MLLARSRFSSEMIEKTFTERGLTTASLAALVVAVLLAVLRLAALLRQDIPVPYEDPRQHFEYGSVGSESSLWIPRAVFEVLPSLFEDLLPPGPGAGYERLGFTYEPGHALPVGVSQRRQPIAVVGLNCAACHAGTLRRAPGQAPEVLPGAPANRFNSEAFFQFLTEVGADPRFEPERLFAAMEERRVPISWEARLYYRLFAIPRTRARLLQLRRQLAGLQRRPAFGPGRADADAIDRAMAGAEAAEDALGTSDYPPLFNQRLHQGAALHFPAADPASLRRVTEWIQDLQPPVYPRERIDLARAERGRGVWDKACNRCHSIGVQLVGRPTPVSEVGTDAELARAKGTDGYRSAPLDGIWARSPYLHNGSVPTLRALLFPEERPEVFFRGYDVFDWERVGYVSSGPEAEKAGFRYDTRLRGNDRHGHTYGESLAVAEKEDLLEYLKTL